MIFLQDIYFLHLITSARSCNGADLVVADGVVRIDMTVLVFFCYENKKTKPSISPQTRSHLSITHRACHWPRVVASCLSPIYNALKKNVLGLAPGQTCQEYERRGRAE